MFLFGHQRRLMQASEACAGLTWHNDRIHLPLRSGNCKDNAREAPARPHVYDPHWMAVRAVCMLVQDWQQSKAVMDVAINRLISVSDRCMQTEIASTAAFSAVPRTSSCCTCKNVCRQAAGPEDIYKDTYTAAHLK